MVSLINLMSPKKYFPSSISLCLDSTLSFQDNRIRNNSCIAISFFPYKCNYCCTNLLCIFLLQIWRFFKDACKDFSLRILHCFSLNLYSDSCSATSKVISPIFFLFSPLSTFLPPNST
jgi:hypothetical protein